MKRVYLIGFSGTICWPKRLGQRLKRLRNKELFGGWRLEVEEAKSKARCKICNVKYSLVHYHKWCEPTKFLKLYLLLIGIFFSKYLYIRLKLILLFGFGMINVMYFGDFYLYQINIYVLRECV